MAGRRCKVTDVRELLRRLRLGEPERRIARDLALSRNTVAHYRHWARAHGLLTGELPDLAQLAALLHPPEPPVIVRPFHHWLLWTSLRAATQLGTFPLPGVSQDGDEELHGQLVAGAIGCETPNGYLGGLVFMDQMALGRLAPNSSSLRLTSIASRSFGSASASGGASHLLGEGRSPVGGSRSPRHDMRQDAGARLRDPL
jgi:hypothetical protein